MKFKRTWFFLSILMITAFAGCKKDKDEASRMDMLTSGQWRITAITATPPIQTPIGMLSDLYTLFFESCRKDNFYIFKKDGKAEINEGATKCAPSDPQTNTIDWSLSSDEKEIILDGERATILELTNSSLRIRGTEEGPTGPVTAEITFSK
jgi:hypothetical protein